MSRRLLYAREVQQMADRGDPGFVVYTRLAGAGNYVPTPVRVSSLREMKPTTEIWVHSSTVEALDTVRGQLAPDFPPRAFFIRSLQGDTTWDGRNAADARYLTEISPGEFRRRSARRFRRSRGGRDEGRPKSVKDLRAKFDAESDALWADFQAGRLTHTEYRKRLDPLEAQLRQDLAAARRAQARKP